MGVRTINLDPASLVDELVGNRDGSTVRVPIAAVGQQIVNTGPVAEALVAQSERLDGLDEDQAAQDVRLAALEGGQTSQAELLVTLQDEQSAQDGRLDVLEAGQVSARLLRASWALLSADSGSADGDGAEVLEGDTGTHQAATATGYNGAVVSNAGLYSWNAAWSRWVRVANPQGAGINARLETEEVATNYVLRARDILSGGSEVASLAVASPQLDNSYGATFTGWGEVYTPAGVSFNAVQIAALGRKADVPASHYWEKIKVTVRTGATPSQPGSTLVAIGEARVLPEASALYSVRILLRDPATGAVKTLSDADFSGGKYFIGVYARRANGGPAYMSPHRGVMSNSDGQSFYLTAANPDTGYWSPFASNWRLGLDHLLVADPVVAAELTPSPGFVGDVLGDLVGVTGYAFDVFEEVSSTAETLALAATGTMAGTWRNLPFSGWGETYTPAGISFNAVRARVLGRSPSVAEAARWSVIKAVVRTGANPSQVGSTLVAVGETRVNRSLDTLSDVVIVLRDPDSGQPKTLTDGDFSGGQYFIGLYARTASGGYAALSEHLGTLPNSAGQSYYVTTQDPLSASWSVNAGNNRLGVDHLQLSDPVEVLRYSASESLKSDIQQTSDLVRWAPPKFYLTEGLETSIYFDNLIAGDFQDYFWAATGYARGAHQHERWTFNLTAGLVASAANASIQIYDKVAESPVAVLSLDFVASGAAAGNGTSPICLFIGDSLTNAGVITQTLLDHAATDVMGVTLIGTRGSGANLHEGRGGYKINDYATAGRTYYAFTVSGVTVAPAINSTQYSHNGAIYLVQEVDLTGGAGTITCSVVSGGAPLSSGTLTRTFGSGDATITFSAAAALSGNPFWIGGQVDFGQWLTDNSFPAPTWVFIPLGTNDVFGQTSDAGVAALAASEFAKLDVLIASIKAADAGTKVALVPPPPPSASQDAFGASYGAAYRRWRAKRNFILWAAAMVEEYAGREGERIFICPAGLNWDTVNNASRGAAAPINSRSSVTAERQNNGVHPSSPGYQQIGDAIWAFLKCQA